MNGRLGWWIGLLLAAGCTSPTVATPPPVTTPSLAPGSLLVPAPAPAEVIAPLSIPGETLDPWSVDRDESPGRLTVAWTSAGVRVGYAVDSSADPSLTAGQSSSLQHHQVALAGATAVLSTVNVADPDGEVPTALWVSRKIADGRYAHIWVSGGSVDDVRRTAGQLIDQPFTLPAAMFATLTLRGYQAIRQTYSSSADLRMAMLDFCRPTTTVATADAAGDCLQLQLNSSTDTVLVGKFAELYGQPATPIAGTHILAERYVSAGSGSTGAVQGAARPTSDPTVAQILNSPATLSTGDLVALFDSVSWRPGFAAR